jgi:undecaprenyl-diphosphatase
LINFIKGIDLKLLLHVNGKLKHDILDRIMPRITVLGDGGIIWILIAFIFIFNKMTRPLGEMIISALILTTILGEGIIKHVIRRARPFVSGIEEKLLIIKPITYSFPSGHTSSSFAAAGILYAMQSKLTLLAFIMAALIAFSRVYLNVHYPTDVFMGIILGLFCAHLVVYVFNDSFLSDLNTLAAQLLHL